MQFLTALADEVFTVDDASLSIGAPHVDIHCHGTSPDSNMSEKVLKY